MKNITKPKPKSYVVTDVALPATSRVLIKSKTGRDYLFVDVAELVIISNGDISFNKASK